MKTLTQYLNWLTITASGLCATLLLVTGAQAADSITTTATSATATFAQPSFNQLIALSNLMEMVPVARFPLLAIVPQFTTQFKVLAWAFATS